MAHASADRQRVLVKSLPLSKMALPLDLVRHVCSFLPAGTRAFLSYGGAYRLLRWPSLSGLQYLELGAVALPSLAAVQFPPRLQALVLHDNATGYFDTMGYVRTNSSTWGTCGVL